jgi:catechol-2,3-dioxygenase
VLTIKRLNHAVLWVRDAQRSLAFYRDVLGFQVVEAPSEQALFLRASGSDNHHDLGLFGIGLQAPPPTQGQQIGLYHLAWEVEALPDLAQARALLLAAGALVGESDHGNSMSLYGQDPDANQFEVFWMLPREEWQQRGIGTRRLDLETELVNRGFAGAQADEPRSLPRGR